MAFDETLVAAVAQPAWDRGQIHLSWTSTAPDGSWFQVYVGRKLAWFGRPTQASIPAPPSRARIVIGAVPAAERSTDFSATLPAQPSDRVTLAWQGGTFEGPDIAGFRIYADEGFGMGGFGAGGFGQASPVATVLAYTPGVYTDGFGYGGFGEGGFGAAAGSYKWTSDALSAGGHAFAVVPFDAQGDEGEAAVASTTIVAPPNPPARDAMGRRLTYTYDPTTHVATLAWLASPE